MTTYYRNGWRAKFVLNGKQVHVPGSPFPSERGRRRKPSTRRTFSSPRAALTATGCARPMSAGTTTALFAGCPGEGLEDHLRGW